MSATKINGKTFITGYLALYFTVSSRPTCVLMCLTRFITDVLISCSEDAAAAPLTKSSHTAHIHHLQQLNTNMIEQQSAAPDNNNNTNN